MRFLCVFNNPSHPDDTLTSFAEIATVRTSCLNTRRRKHDKICQVTRRLVNSAPRFWDHAFEDA